MGIRGSKMKNLIRATVLWVSFLIVLSLIVVGVMFYREIAAWVVGIGLGLIFPITMIKWELDSEERRKNETVSN
jgi:hypothetical protein